MKISHALWAAAAVAGVVVFTTFYEAAFPAAAIELELSRSEVKARAEEYIRGHGIDPDTFKSTLTFGVDNTAATFLQRTRGIEETNRFARESLPLWNWRVRWFRSGEKEEFRLTLTPAGEPLRFTHEIPETEPGDSLTLDSARVLASRFATEERGLDLAAWRLEEQATEARERRLDHSFTWERIGSELEWRPDDPEAGTASLRFSISIHGSEVGRFGTILRVPESFRREQSKQESVATLLTLVSFGLMLLLVIAGAIVAIRRFKQERLQWGAGLVLAALVGGTVVGTGFVSFPLLKAQYPTDLEFPIFVATALIGVLLAGLIYGLAVWVVAAAGESLARERIPRAIRAFGDWMERRWLTHDGAREILVGYAVALAFLGYITGFYLLGRRYLGVWVPVDSPHSTMVSMYLPWLVPLLIGVQASVSEEALFRLFGVSFCKRYVRSTVVALLIPAVIWAFAHSNYAVFPVYVRGVELTIAGFVFGWVFLRHGLVAMLVAHYAIDAILLSLPFLRSAGGTYVSYGIVALVLTFLPLVVPMIVGLRGRTAAAR